jgi:hypothetical protein
MSLISTTIPNLVNGVSQQPYTLRLASQCEEQFNGYSSVVEGLRKRPPSRFRGVVSNTAMGNAFIHTINRDLAERYVVIATNGNLRVFDMGGGEKVVNFPAGKTYLASQTPDTDFAAVTVADYTFFLNKKKVVGKLPELSPQRSPEALIWVKQGAYGLTYNITLPGFVSATITTADGSSPAHAAQIATDKIASDLFAALNGNSAFQGAFGIERAGSSLRIWKKDGSDFSITYSDGLGDLGMKLVKGSVQRFSDLPARGFNNFQVQITGDASSAFDDYWVAYSEDTTNPNSSVWLESRKGGEEYKLDPSTLPHGLVREADGTFTFKPLEWAARMVGDELSNPFPSFVDRTINDVFFHRNRLGFVADENVIFSQHGEFFDFFKGSATQLIDTDPIDVAVSHTKVSIIRHAIAFNESLLLFSDQTQFMLGSTDLLSPLTVSINQTTEFQCSLIAKPVGAGRNVYFTVNKGAYSGFREYYVDGETRTNDAADITSHVPSYVAGGVTKIAASSNEDVLVCLSPKRPNSLFVYKYFWQEGEKLQSSWSRWDFSTDTRILYVEFMENELWMLVERQGQTVFETISLEAGYADGNLEFAWHVDQKVEADDCVVTYDADLDETHIQSPYLIAPGTSSEFELIAAGSGPYIIGQFVPHRWEDGKFVVRGDLTGGFWLGRNYRFRYKFSTLIIKEEAPGGGQMSVGEGKVQLRRMTLSYNKSGYFQVFITPSRRNPYVSTFSGRVAGSGQNVLGAPALEEGRFPFGILGNNETTDIEIISDNAMPCAFLGAEWEALYQIRSQRL